MPKPIAEQSTTLKAGKKKGKADDDTPTRSLMEPVGGGRVRVIEFEESHGRSSEVHYEPKHSASMDHIHFEVDNIDRLQRGSEPRRHTARTSRRVFETKKGGVNAADVDTHRGSKRVLYTERRKGSRTEETRFHSGMVDKIIAERYKDGPTFEAVDEEKPKFGLFKKKGEAQTVSKKTTTTTRTVTDSEGKVTKTTKKETTGWAPPADSKTEAEAVQCAAYTKAGDQCKRDARKRSKYCTQHRGYRAPSKADLAK